MTEQPKDGGPAFPFSPNDHSTANYIAEGMSLRDWFAAAALTGLVTREDVVGTQANIRHVKAALADLSYAYADAMLAAREEKP